EGGSHTEGWRGPDRVPGRLPDAGHRLRRHQRFEQPCSETKSRAVELFASGRVEHAAPDDVSCGAAQPESGDRESMSDERRNPVIAPGHTFATVTDKISAIVLTRKTPTHWLIPFAVASTLLMVFLWAVTYLFVRGVGIYGVKIP